MRALAEFIVRGRLQAGAMAVLGYLIPLLTPVTVALVTLRKGASEGTIILFLGLLPALLSLLMSDGSSVVIWVTLLSLIVVYVPAIVLRITVSLPAMIVSSLLTATLISVLITTFSAGYIDRLVESLSDRIVSAQEQVEASRDTNTESNSTYEGTESSSDPVAELSDSDAPTVGRVSIVGMITYILAFNGLTGVLIGRWLQAIAFNPGGFGSEFRELRLNLPLSAICFALSLLLRFQGDEYIWWSNLFALPLVMVAIAIAHSFAKARDVSTPWLVLFYLATIIFMPVVICIGFVDAWVNFRDRFAQRNDRPD